MILEAENFKFDFPNAISLFKFDEKENLSPYYHGVSTLKAVDVIAEFEDCQIWIEVKEYSLEECAKAIEERPQRGKEEIHIRSWLINNLTFKFRDTFLYRYAEKEVSKPIVYVCLMNFSDSLLSGFRKELNKRIPVGNVNNSRWKRSLLSTLLVLDADKWNRHSSLNRFGTITHL